MLVVVWDNCDADEEVSTDWDCNETDDADEIFVVCCCDVGGGVLLGVWCLFKSGVLIDPEAFGLIFTLSFSS